MTPARVRRAPGPEVARTGLGPRWSAAGVRLRPGRSRPAAQSGHAGPAVPWPWGGVTPSHGSAPSIRAVYGLCTIGITLASSGAAMSAHPEDRSRQPYQPLGYDEHKAIFECYYPADGSPRESTAETVRAIRDEYHCDTRAVRGVLAFLDLLEELGGKMPTDEKQWQRIVGTRSALSTYRVGCKRARALNASLERWRRERQPAPSGGPAAPADPRGGGRPSNLQRTRRAPPQCMRGFSSALPVISLTYWTPPRRPRAPSGRCGPAPWRGWCQTNAGCSTSGRRLRGMGHGWPARSPPTCGA